MKGIPEFFRKVIRSCYDVEWYREVRALTVGAGLRYAALFHALVAVCAGILLVPGLLGLRANVIRFFDEELPDDAYVAVEEGEFVTNLETPFVRTVEGATFMIDPSVDGLDFPEAFEGNDPVVVLGKRAVYVQVDATDRRVIPNEPGAAGRLTLADVMGVINSVSAAMVVLVAVLAAFAYGLFAFIMNAGFAWLAAYVLKYAGRRYGAPLAWDRWFVVALFALTLPTVVDGLMLYLGVRTPFVYTGLFALIVSAVFMDEKQNPVEGLAHEPVIAPAPVEEPAVPENDKEDDKEEDADKKE